MLRLFVFSLAALAVLSISMSDPAAKNLDSTRTSLLDDHLNILLPADMKVLPDFRNTLLAPAKSTEDKSKVILDEGTARFVLVAYELYALAGSDVKATIEAEMKRRDLKGTLEPLALPKPLVGFGMTPMEISKGRVNLVYAAWIVSSDGSVQYLPFHVNLSGTEQGESWATLGKKIAATIAPGKRLFDTTAGDRVLDELVMTVPQGWVASVHRHGDYAMYHLHKLERLGKDAPLCVFEIGENPPPERKRTGIEAKPTVVAGKLLEIPTEWSTWAGGGWFHTETRIKHPDRSGMVQVFCSTTDQLELAGLRRMVETLRRK